MLIAWYFLMALIVYWIYYPVLVMHAEQIAFIEATKVARKVQIKANEDLMKLMRENVHTEILSRSEA